MAPEAEPPSPKFHEYEAIDPSGSDEPDPFSVTVNGALPEAGVAVARAMGGVLGAATVIVSVSELVLLLLSVTLRVAL